MRHVVSQWHLDFRKQGAAHDDVRSEWLRSSLAVLGFMLILFGATSLIAAGEQFQQHQQKGIESFQEAYAAVVDDHGQDSTVLQFQTRLESIDQLVEILVRNMQTSKDASFDALLGDLVELTPVPAMAAKPASKSRSAAELLREYESSFSGQLSSGDLTENQFHALQLYGQVYIESAQQYVLKQASQAFTVEDNRQDELLAWCLVLPFLQTPDRNWSLQDIAALPAWMQRPKALATMERFALHIQRPQSAHQFSRFRVPGGASTNDSSGYLAYLQNAGEDLQQEKAFYAAQYVLRSGRMLAEAQGLKELAAEFGFAAGEVLSSAGHSRQAAEEIQFIIDGSVSSTIYAKAVSHRLKYLYEGWQFEQVLAESPVYEADPRCREILPTIIYIAWASARRGGQADEAERLQKHFLKAFPEHELGAEIYFALAMQAIALNQHDKALELLKVVEQRYPESRMLAEARKVQTYVVQVASGK